MVQAPGAKLEYDARTVRASTAAWTFTALSLLTDHKPKRSS